MLDIILDTLLDGLKILPFLWVAFLIIELLEHKFSKQSKKIIEKSGRFGPLLGAILGCFPQCGFSVMATNLYVTRIISLGTLVSIYLATSDEMLPILISHGVDSSEIIKLLGIKLIFGFVFGFVIDLFFKKKEEVSIKELCEEEHCHCEDGVIVSSFKHMINTLAFIMVVSFLLNVIMHYGGKEFLSTVLKGNNLLSIFVSGLIGLVPNCASSVVITELYLNEMLSLSSTMAGLLCGSGVAILVLFRSNKDRKENVKILVLVYFIGIISGLLLEILSYWV